jgi:branched-chain amino acid transport system substrate-binding protein
MRRNSFEKCLCSLSVAILAGSAAFSSGKVLAEETIKIGLVMPMTGILGPVGKQAVAGAKLYVAQHGDRVSGRKIELIVRDDASVPDNSKRLTQELLVSDKVAILGGGLTPNVLAIAPLVNASKTATVVMVSGTSVVTERSPYFVRTSWTHAQQASVLAKWASRNGSKRATIIASD